MMKNLMQLVLWLQSWACLLAKAFLMLYIKSWVSDDFVYMQEVTSDPLDAYCQETPEADECRVYED